MSDAATDTLDPPDFVDDHYLPQDVWDAIVERAEEIHAERFAEPGGGAGDFEAMGLTPIYKQFSLTPYDKSSTLVRPQLYVIHTAECPLRVGYAASLTEWADGDSYKPRASWHRFVDPATVALFIPLGRAAWHAAGGNSVAKVGYEQAGYASYTREQWLSPDGRRQLDLLAQQIVKDGLNTAAEIQWLSDAQVKAILAGTDRTTVGLCTHEQVSRLSGRTSRTDPGKGYPKDYLLAGIRHYAGLGEAPTPPPAKPSVTLEPDGKWGPSTTHVLQRVFGTKVDGEVSNQTYAIRDAHPGLKARANWEFNDTRRGSDLIRAMMRRLARKGLYTGTIDGLAGPMFWKAFHRDLGLGLGDNIDNPDPAIAKMQKLLNEGKYRP